MSTEPKTFRVVQWATGDVGTRSLWAVIDHPHLELVGLYTSSPGKAGQDAGTLCGLAPVGIKATSSIDEIVALDADCVLHMRQGIDYDELCRLLASGKNVVTTRGEFHYPAKLDPDIRTRVEGACFTGGTSIYSTGVSPGFITEAITIPLISLQRRLECLTIDEYADMSRRESAGLLFDIMGFGREPTPAGGPQRGAPSSSMLSFSQIADAINLPFDDIVTEAEAALATRDVEIAAGTIRAGTVAAQRITTSGLRNGEPLMRFRANWYCTTDIDKDWDLLETGWRVQVEGDCPLDINFRYPIPMDDYPKVMPALTAFRAVNAVAAVCDAEPGIRTTADLPQVIATF